MLAELPLFAQWLRSLLIVRHLRASRNGSGNGCEQILSQSQIEAGLTEAFECSPAPSHDLVFSILEAARSRVEDGLPPYGDLRARPTPEETQWAIEELEV